MIGASRRTLRSLGVEWCVETPLRLIGWCFKTRSRWQALITAERDGYYGGASRRTLRSLGVDWCVETPLRLIGWCFKTRSRWQALITAERDGYYGGASRRTRRFLPEGSQNRRWSGLRQESAAFEVAGLQAVLGEPRLAGCDPIFFPAFIATLPQSSRSGNMARTKWTRRDVLRAGSAAVALPALIPSRVLGLDGATSANERVIVGIIGLGGRAGSIANDCKLIPEMKVAAVCDCFKPAIDAFVKHRGKDQNWSTYEDIHEMFEKENLDGVMVETTTHARAWIVINAMQAGLDTYIEKPMCLTIGEGRTMVNAARKYERVTQVGTQQRSMPINTWASDLVKNGALGKIKTVLAPNFVGAVKWTGNETEPLPEGGKKGWWDVWTNQAEMRPYHHSLHHGWEKWWDYDGGGLCYGVTGWGTHSYDQIQRALGTDDTGPVEILLEEEVADRPCGKFETVTEVDETRLDYLIRLAKPVVGPRAKVRMWYANGTELRLHLDGEWGSRPGRHLRWRKGQAGDQPQQDCRPQGVAGLARESGSDHQAGDAVSHRELGGVHQDAGEVQCRHRDRPASHVALLSRQSGPRSGTGGQAVEVGSRCRAFHQLRRGQPVDLHFASSA